MTKKSKHDVKRGEIRKVNKQLTSLLNPFGVTTKKMIVFGSRTKSTGHHDSDLDIVIIPTKRTWKTPQEYTALSKAINQASEKNLRFRGNKIDLQLVPDFDVN